MGPMASQITSLTTVYSTVCSGTDQRKHKALRHWHLCGEFTGDRWIPAQMANNVENVSIWWRHHDLSQLSCVFNYRCLWQISRLSLSWRQWLNTTLLRRWRKRLCWRPIMIESLARRRSSPGSRRDRTLSDKWEAVLFQIFTSGARRGLNWAMKGKRFIQ